MAINTLPNDLTSALNRAQPGSLPNELASIGLGTILRQKLPVTLRAAVPSADAYSALGTVALVLPDDAKCATILSAYPRAGTATVAVLTPEIPGATLSTLQCAPAPNGNILFYAADAWTSVDVVYRVESQDVVELTLPCASGVITLPTGVLGAGAVTLMEAQRADSSTAALTVAMPAATNSTTGTAHFNLAKTTVLLNSGDSATMVRVKLGVASAVDLNALLKAVSVFI